MSENIHVIPIDDLNPHQTHLDSCHCEPRVETQPNGSKVIIHNSYDGREFFETTTINRTSGH